MLTLRLSSFPRTEANRYRAELSLDGEGSRRTATTEFEFVVTNQDREDLRWYLEDYLEFADATTATIAARVEKRMARMGTELFQKLFEADRDGNAIWDRVHDRLEDVRIEVVTGVREATALPWELLRDPRTDTPLALSASAFVRTEHQSARRPQLPKTSKGPIRILLVICRPGGRVDVPFRSVASRLIKSLGDGGHEAFQLDVLRPPTFEQLSKVLHAAKQSEKPYHVVHFDGHGTYAEAKQGGNLAAILQALGPLALNAPRTGAHGYLLFENPKIKENTELIDGPSLGKLLVQTSVPVLVLNACRSAHAEAPNQPDKADDRTAKISPKGDVHTQVRAFGSLAQEVMDAGAAGVVAMRYNVYVVTAAQFVADLYGALTQGQTLGEAVTLGRKQLETNPFREVAYEPRKLQDWPVPIVYEAAPVALFPKRANALATLSITVTEGDSAPTRGRLSKELEERPDAGFFGRDETLLALDRAFDTQHVVLLHAYAGSGKTATAKEFARWYALTGGVAGPVLFTTFERHKPLARVLDDFGQTFAPLLEQNGIQWSALTDDPVRQDIALQVLAQVPVLWVWDNVEPIAGFPAGTPSAWSNDEQKELLDFLRAAQQTRARFLLTSRREEQDWLGLLPARIPVPPMPMRERVQFARALAEKHQRRLTGAKEIENWRPLLQFTQGNPLTITVLVSQALRDGLKTREQIEAFVSRLRAGEAAFADEQSEGRSQSLSTSLSYGFSNTFTEVERKQLSLLHFFQGFVDVVVLRIMGAPEADWCLPEVRGLTREAGIALLDRAAEVGLLTAHGSGYYTIHPALPWFFKSLFDTYFAPTPTGAETERTATTMTDEGTTLSATYAFINAVGELGNYYFDQYESGNRDVISVLSFEESNLLHARHLARTQGWWGRVISNMQSLRVLYEHTGRRAEWARLVNEIVPDFVDPVTDGPLPNREEQWHLVTEYRVQLAREARQWEQAERLQRTLVDWSRQQTAAIRTEAPETWDERQRHVLRILATLLGQLGLILRERGQPECIAVFEESLLLLEQTGNQPSAAIAAFNLGHAYTTVPACRDLAQAEHWYRRSLERRDQRDRFGRGKCQNQLGVVANTRFQEARATGQPEEELLLHLNTALKAYYEALDLLPSNAMVDLAVTHDGLGNVYGNAGDVDRALPHYRESIRYLETAGDAFHAAQTRFNVALALANAGRFADAREYAAAALRGYETFGDRAAAQIERTQELIAVIDQSLVL